MQAFGKSCLPKRNSLFYGLYLQLMVSPPWWKLCSKTYSGQIMGSEFRIGSSQETKYDVACTLLQHTQTLVCSRIDTTLM